EGDSTAPARMSYSYDSIQENATYSIPETTQRDGCSSTLKTLPSAPEIVMMVSLFGATSKKALLPGFRSVTCESPYRGRTASSLVTFRMKRRAALFSICTIVNGWGWVGCWMRYIRASAPTQWTNPSTICGWINGWRYLHTGAQISSHDPTPGWRAPSTVASGVWLAQLNDSLDTDMRSETPRRGHRRRRTLDGSRMVQGCATRTGR